MPKIRPWMEGTLVASYRCGVRVYDLGYCLSRCGSDRPFKCPDSKYCSRFQVYVVRWNQNGSYEWRQAHACAAREEAFKLAAERADSEEYWATYDPTLRKFINAAQL